MFNASKGHFVHLQRSHEGAEERKRRLDAMLVGIRQTGSCISPQLTTTQPNAEQHPHDEQARSAMAPRRKYLIN